MSIAIAQRKIEQLIKIAVVEHPIDIAKFTTTILQEILPKVKEELGLNFDKVVVHPGPQPRGSADIELYLQNQIAGRINLKTCVSGNLNATIRKLKESISPWEDGMVILFVLFKDRNGKETLRLVIFYMPSYVVRNFAVRILHEALEEMLKNKTKSEGYTQYHILEVTSAIGLWRARQILIVKEIAEKAIAEAREAKEEAREAKEEVKKLRETVEEILLLVKQILKKIEEK